MMTAEQIIQTICPKLSGSPSLSQFIQIAKESLSSRFFGSLYEQAVAYKACHLFTITDTSDIGEILSAGGGSVNHLQEGGITVGFNNSNSESELSSTKYGRMLLDLMKTRPTMDVNKNCRPPFIGYPYI
ncbi:DUF4054 domain-containing protein [Methanobrevibacter sp.]|uniref:DUF4054 domain-containing protein n=1 Tax=Methanobrevibacter sp. TaxID=66852 RepID=UPI00386DCF2E